MQGFTIPTLCKYRAKPVNIQTFKKFMETGQRTLKKWSVNHTKLGGCINILFL